MKALYNYLLMGASLVCSLPVLTACDDDEAVDPYDINYVYIYSPNETESNLEYKGNGTFIISIDEDCTINPVRCTKPAPADLTVKLAVDASLVDSYNADHGTNYTLLKNVQLENTTLVIRQGEYISADSLKLHYTDMSEFQDGAENYILPIAITSVTGGNTVISNQTGKVFLTFTSRYKANEVNFYGTGTSMTIKLADGQFTNAVDELDLGYIMAPAWAADTDIEVKVKIDNTLIATYNALNGINGVVMPEVSLKSDRLAIGAGEMGPSEYIVLDLSQSFASLPLEAQTYVVPVVIESVSGVGAEVGTNRVYYVVFQVVETITLNAATEPSGTALTDVEEWNITVNGNVADPSYGYEWKDLFRYPGDTSVNYWYRNRVMEIDMGTAARISSIGLYFYGWSYSLQGVRVEISEDGAVYKSGECTLTQAESQYVSFAVPPMARFIRITPLGTSGYPYPTGVRIYAAVEE